MVADKALFEQYVRYENDFNDTTSKNKMVPDFYEKTIKNRCHQSSN